MKNGTNNQKNVINFTFDPAELEIGFDLKDKNSETFTKQEILDHFRDVYGITDESVIFLICAETFLQFQLDFKRNAIARFALSRPCSMTLSLKNTGI